MPRPLSLPFSHSNQTPPPLVSVDRVTASGCGVRKCWQVWEVLRKSAVLHSSHLHWRETDGLREDSETNFWTGPLSPVSFSRTYRNSEKFNLFLNFHFLPANPRSTTANDRPVFLFWSICEESEAVMDDSENTTKSCKTSCQTCNLWGQCSFTCLFGFLLVYSLLRSIHHEMQLRKIHSKAA